MEELWPSSSSDDDQSTIEQCSSESTYRLIWKLLFFLIFWQMFFKVLNTAITFLLRFLKYFVRTLGKAFENAQLETFSRTMPITYNSMLLRTGVSSSDFEYVVCPSCHSVYSFEDCIEYARREKCPKQCGHVSYPNHPHVARRQPCGTSLLKIVQTSKGIVS